MHFLMKTSAKNKIWIPRRIRMIFEDVRITSKVVKIAAVSIFLSQVDNVLFFGSS